MKPKKIKEAIYTVSFMFVMTLIFISALAFTNIKTREKREANQQLTTQRAILKVAQISFTDENINEIFSKFIILEKDENNRSYYRVQNDNKDLLGIVVMVSGKGLWGDMEGVMGFEEDQQTITGFEITKHAETPGLGARVDEKWFKDQFNQKRGSFNRIIEEKSSPKDDEIQGITGATLTTDGIKNMVNDGLKYVALIKVVKKDEVNHGF